MPVISRTISDFDQLIARYNGHVTVACDTEFQGPHTLTAQFAARLGEDLVVEVYSSPASPGQPDPDKLLPLLKPLIEKTGLRIVPRDGRRITAEYLSPTNIVTDLFGLRGVESSPRFSEEHNSDLDGTLTVTLVGHFWTADFFRVFGRNFFAALAEHQIRGGWLVIQGRRLLSFKDAGRHRYGAPVLEYAGHVICDDCVREYAIKVNYFDTCLAFSYASAEPQRLPGHHRRLHLPPRPGAGRHVNRKSGHMPR
jgi:hypothetical protein